MRFSKPIGWTSFVLFILSALVLVAVIVLAGEGLFEGANPGAILWIIGGLSLISTVLGLVSFKTPQGKIGAFGSLFLLAMVLFVTPTSSLRGPF